MRPPAPVLPILAAAAGIAVYSAMDVLMKRLSIEAGAYAAVLWRSLAGVAVLAPAYVARRRCRPRGRALRLHVVRGGAAGASVLLFFWGLARVPMAQGVAITFLAPLIATFLAAAMLGERVRAAALAGSGIAGLGVLAIAVGEVAAAAPAAAVAGSVAILIASLLYAVSLVLLRQQAQVADPLEIALFTSVVIAAAMMPAAPWLAPWPVAAQVPAIVAAALLGTVSALLVAWAYARAEAQRLAPVEYTAFVWAALFGRLAFGEAVSPWTLGGAVLIVAGCVVGTVQRGAAAPLTEAAA